MDRVTRIKAELKVGRKFLAVMHVILSATLSNAFRLASTAH